MMEEWQEKMQKCIESPYYFYINYCKEAKIESDTRYTEEQFNELIRQGLTIRQITNE